jgi:anhydro-N-acetylmuramic acid kinase
MLSEITLMNEHYDLLGLMSGTSLDGLDVAYCRFSRVDGQWQYSIVGAETYEYPQEWIDNLTAAEIADGRKLVELHSAYGRYCGSLVNRFISETGLYPGFIASHGHTVFHRPELGYTFQLGNGADLAAETGLTTICDFRTADVALGGQGAPLVPVGDQLLFGDFEYCLNIGGFANVSYDQDGKRIAYDICPANIILNRLAGLTGSLYDKDGNLAAKGKPVPGLLTELEKLTYYSAPPPKSLGKEWMVNNFIPVIEKYKNFPVPDLLNTVVEHIALMAGNAVSIIPAGRVLITGGGALNTYLVSRIMKHCDIKIVIPDLLTVKFKEALIFAFLGLLRFRGDNNCLASVTGARRDHCSGIVFLSGK